MNIQTIEVLNEYQANRRRHNARVFAVIVTIFMAILFAIMAASIQISKTAMGW